MLHSVSAGIKHESLAGSGLQLWEPVGVVKCEVTVAFFFWGAVDFLLGEQNL